MKVSLSIPMLISTINSLMLTAKLILYSCVSTPAQKDEAKKHITRYRNILRIINDVVAMKHTLSDLDTLKGLSLPSHTSAMAYLKERRTQRNQQNMTMQDWRDGESLVQAQARRNQQ